MSKAGTELPADQRPPDWHLAAIIDSSDDAIVSKSLEGIIATWNPAAERIFGYTADEVIGMPISIIVPPELGSEEPEILAKISRGEKIEHFETTRVRKDGKRIQVSVTISPIRDTNGKIIGASKIARDITEQKAAQEQIRLERERLRVTLGSIGDAVVVTDTRGFVDFLNPIAESMTGWRSDEAFGKPLETVFCIIDETTRQRLESPAARALNHGTVVELANHTLLVARDGTEVAIDDSAAPIKDSAGRVSGAILVFRDVTGARAINDFRQRLAAIVESSEDAIIGKDLDGRITSWNQGAERIFGYSQAQALGRPITMLIPPERLAEETEILKKLREGKRIEHFETIRIAKNRRRLDVSISVSPIRDSEGQVIGASKIARDITQTKAAAVALARAHEQLRTHTQDLEHQVAERTAELRQNFEELQTFSSGLSHDIKAPLRAVICYAETLVERCSESMTPECRDYARRVLEGCERLNRFVENVLSYTKVRGAGVRPQTVSLEKVVGHVLEDYPHTKEADAKVKVEKPLPSVQADESLLAQALSNLVSNAVKFVRPNTRPEVKIRAERQAGKVRLWVEDNGIGIAPEDQQKVFGLFTRLNGAAEYEGTGIGLAVVDRAARRMGGEVGVVSEKNKGSRFWIELNEAPKS